MSIPDFTHCVNCGKNCSGDINRGVLGPQVFCSEICKKLWEEAPRHNNMIIGKTWPEPQQDKV